MATVNRPDKLTVSSVNDPNLGSSNISGVYNDFTVNLQTPVLNAKGIQMINANLTVSPLALNDTNGECIFWYWCSGTSGSTTDGTQADNPAFSTGFISNVRLYPSDYSNGAALATTSVNFTKNRPLVATSTTTVVDDLVSLLNTAATTGDNQTYNPLWRGSIVKFVNVNGKILLLPISANKFVSPLASDDPQVKAALSSTSNQPRMPLGNYNSGTSASFLTAYADSPKQPATFGISMADKLGYTITYAQGTFTRKYPNLYYTCTYPFNNQMGALYPSSESTNGYSKSVLPDSYPNLLGTTSVNVYMDVVNGSGLDGSSGKSLIATIPIDSFSTKQAYTFNSVEKPALSLPSELYSMRISMTDQDGLPLNFPNSTNTAFTFCFYY